MKGQDEKAVWLTQRLVNERYRPRPIKAPSILVLSNSLREQAGVFSKVLFDVTMFELDCNHEAIQIDQDIIQEWTEIFATELNRLEATV